MRSFFFFFSPSPSLYFPDQSGQPPAAGNDGSCVPDRHLALLLGLAPDHRPAHAPELHGAPWGSTTARPAHEVPDVAPAVRQLGRRLHPAQAAAPAERQPPAVARVGGGIRWRRAAGGAAAAAVGEGQHGARAAPSAELHPREPGVTGVTGGHSAVHTAVDQAAASAAALAQTHHEQTGGLELSMLMLHG